MGVIRMVGFGLERPFPGALAGSLGAAVVTVVVAWWLFSALRRTS
jgi:hypothetical protein